MRRLFGTGEPHLTTLSVAVKEPPSFRCCTLAPSRDLRRAPEQELKPTLLQ